jgi:ATP-binding cassette, subfamily B, bacterial PglK
MSSITAKQIKCKMNSENLLRRLWAHIEKKRKKQFILMAILMFVTSIMEVVSIGAVLPFLSVISSPDSVRQNPWVHYIFWRGEDVSSGELVQYIAYAFVLAVVLAGAFRVVQLKAITSFSYSIGADINLKIYRSMLYQPYIVHASRNSSEIISAITGKADGVISNTVIPLLTILSSLMMLLTIISFLIKIDPYIACMAISGFAVIYLLIARLTKKRLLADSQRMAAESINRIKTMQEGLGGIRDVIIDGSQELFCNIFSASDLALRKAQENSVVISSSPRFIVEALGMLLISSFALFLIKDDSSINLVIPILGAFALGAQRALPILQQSYSSWVSLNSSKSSLKDVLDLLDAGVGSNEKNNYSEKNEFKESIVLKNVKFKYGQFEPNILNGINLEIKKGDRIGIVGETGSGKSTLVDVLMGLLEPTQGELIVDGKKLDSKSIKHWHSNLSHVPQNIYISDANVIENIAFGCSKQEVNIECIKEAASMSKISETIDKWHEGYYTVLGERGVRLSGGQRQRVGLARAIYKRSNIIFFDEATSSLDSETEMAVMDSIQNLGNDITIIIVAHRTSTLKGCTKIVELKRGVIARTGTYNNMFSQ